VFSKEVKASIAFSETVFYGSTGNIEKHKGNHQTHS